MSRPCAQGAECKPQRGVQLEQLGPGGKLHAELATCNKHIASPGPGISTEDADPASLEVASEAGESTGNIYIDRPWIGFTAHSGRDYRPCDVASSGARVCELIAGGAVTESPKDCALLCACLRDQLAGAECNAATWAWGDDVGNGTSNCFPKHIEGIDISSGEPPQEACRREAHTLLILHDSSAGDDTGAGEPDAGNSSEEGYCQALISNAEPSSNSSQASIIAGSVAAAVVALAAIFIIAFCLWRKHRSSRSKPSAAADAPYTANDMADRDWLSESSRTLSASMQSSWTRQLSITTKLSKQSSLPAPINEASEARRRELQAALAPLVHAHGKDQSAGLFADRFVLLDGQFHGRRTVVQLAREKNFRYHAVKFYLDKDAFDQASDKHRSTAGQAVLPPVIHGSESGHLRGSSGFCFPHMVQEQGCPLPTWLAQKQHKGLEIATLVEALAHLVKQLHLRGMVLTHMQPHNLLHLMHSAEWRLVNICGSVTAGEVQIPACSWQYAPPEAVRAMHTGTSLQLRPSFDMWCLAVIAFEVITRTQACESDKDALACAMGQRIYPWRAPEEAQPQAWRDSALRRLLMPCLEPNPTHRPSASAVHAAVSKLC